MNNHLLIKDFTNKLRPSVETLTLEINKPQIDTKECIDKIKQIKTDIGHLHNLLKIEEVLEKEKHM
jgi:hypothetical protein